MQRREYKLFILSLVYIVCALFLADCDDPGTPRHGYRKVSSIGIGFPVGAVISFHCNETYQLNGTKKIECNSHNRWSGKVPKCLSQGKSHALWTNL